jgi:hypothetical protein
MTIFVVMSFLRDYLTKFNTMEHAHRMQEKPTALSGSAIYLMPARQHAGGLECRWGKGIYFYGL